MQSLSKYNKGIKYLFCAIDLFSKYAWILLLKDNRRFSIFNAFQKIISKGRKPNKIWVDQGGEFYNKLFKRCLKINNIEMYSTYNEGKSVVAERFVRTLKNMIFKHMTAVSKNAYFDVLDNSVNKYNNTVNRTVKMEPIDVTSDSYAEYNEGSNEKDPKFKVGDHVRISKYKNNFAKENTQNWSEEVFIISKIKNTVSWTYVVSDLNGEKTDERFMKKNCEKQNLFFVHIQFNFLQFSTYEIYTNQNAFRIEKAIKRKGNELYVKWKGYDNLSNSWINKKDLY